MKQLKKLGSQGARVLTDDQMRNVKGGESIPFPRCTPDKPGATCSTSASCSVTDAQGNIHYGTCGKTCLCYLFLIP